MTVQKIREIVDFYEQVLKERGNNSAQYHCLRMIPRMRLILDEGRIEKAFRWLGFIQGVLFSTGVFTVEDLKNHSRPDRD